VKVASIVDQKAVQAILLADQPKLFNGSRGEIADFGNYPPATPALDRHFPLIAQKKPAMNRQADEIERQKDQR
jgi:hypothetical protein